MDPATVILLLVLLGLIVIVGLWVAMAYNRLVRKRVQAENAWSQIDVQLKRRHDLIPNLVETVKGYASHERETLESVIRARQQAVDASGIQDQAQAENLLTGALRQLFALSESYPDLKANQNFMKLQEELTGTENRIGFARQHFNNTVGQYNTAVQQFPTNVIAGTFGFQQRDFFEIEDPGHREAPEVKF
ncbi:LemA family protein [Phycisphaerales bacterium AB-hyl4]|uniref:LemA family protein n=1 Tax=Natronomicrosphaera hydrolytica TaxID=3242702 RepID=A0ABV4U7D5_9BACT